MIKIYESDNLVQLAESLRKSRNQKATTNPLLPEQIVVQNNDIARWLTLYLAEKEGITANLEFKFPAELFWDIMRVMDPDIPDDLPSDRGPMAWSIFQILQSGNDPALAVLHQYINHENRHIREMRCWNLANRISDVFDQYLLYRPEMLLAWERNELVTNLIGERWQAYLWHRLAKRWQNESEMHRARLQKQFFKNAKSGSFSFEKLPQHITIFWPIDVPPSYFKLITQLGKLTDLVFFRQKMEVKEDHLLMKSFNQKADELEEILCSSLAASNASIDRKPIHNDESKHHQTGFLDILKTDLQLGLNDTKPASTDLSFQIHSCHSARREVEVLYDQLLFLLDRDEQLYPSDITIVCPQIEEYAADIEAVFGAPEEEIPEIPFHISDVSATSNSMESGLKKLLDLIGSRFKMTDVIDLLECEPVKDKLELSQEDLSTLTKWITQNRIRWGMDGRQKESLGLPGTKTYTWQSGLHRMMAGYSMEMVDDLLFQGIYPYDEVDQSEHGLLLAKLYRFMHRLFECHKQIQEPKTPEKWSRLINQWLSEFFIEIPANHSQKNRLMQTIDSLNEASVLGGWEGKVSFQIARAFLENALQTISSSNRRGRRGVTFSSIVSKHGIPAKFTGMIGMNDGDFPRSKTTPDFDLITRNPQKGDRSPAKDDRQFFLDYLLTAAHGIYFSFVGQSNRSESEYPPSAVLQELIDYIAERYNIEEEDLVLKHRLQPFSKDYFDKEKGKLFSYSQQNCRLAEQLSRPVMGETMFLSEPLPEPEDALKKITLQDFITFFQQPAKYLLQRRFGIHFQEDDIPDENRESFELSALDKSHFERELGSRAIQNQPVESYFNVVRGQNRLPDGWSGQQGYNSQFQRAETFSRYIKSKVPDDLLDPVEVDYSRNDIRIMGRLDSVYQDKQWLYRFGKGRPKDLIDLWIRHLFLQLAKPDDHSGESRLLTHGKGKDKAKAYSFKLTPITEPEDILSNLIKAYRTGLRQSFLFFPNTSYAYAEAILQQDKDEKKALQRAEKEWNDPHRSFPQEASDPYNICSMNNTNRLDANNITSMFKKNSILIWKPFFNNLSERNESMS